MKKPVIFLAFSNDRDNYLKMIVEERKSIYRSLRPFHDAGNVQVEAEANSSIEDIFEIFNHYNHDIVIFHYGGHAGSTFLQLEGENATAKPAFALGLAQLLGYQKNLQLVFLNGCATQPQVKMLLDNGVKAVIATSVAIQDDMAMEFSEQFYTALSKHMPIGAAFMMASAFISSKYHLQDHIQTYRSIGLPEDSEDTKFPWGLYLNKDADDVLNWVIPEIEVAPPSTNNFYGPPVFQSVITENLLQRTPISNVKFVGYEEEINLLKSSLEEHMVVAIEGLGGVGKTELAMEFIERFVPQKEQIIWISPMLEFDVMIQQSGYGELLRTPGQNLSQKFKSLEGLWERDNRIVFIEDFHENQDETYTQFFEQLSINKTRLIIITRFLPPEIEVGQIIKLEGLGKDALEHAQNLKSKKKAYSDIPNEELETLCELVEGHPLSIELGLQLLSYGESAKNILQAISGEEYEGHKKIDELSQRLIHEVLNNEYTVKKEQDLLQRFSVYRDKVPIEAIEALYEEEVKIKYPLSQLIEKSLIRLKDKYYDMAPLIREFCLAQSTSREKDHGYAAHYFIAQRTKQFDLGLEEKILYHLFESKQWEEAAINLGELGKCFITEGQHHLLSRMINELNANDIFEPLLEVFKAQIFIYEGKPKDAIAPLLNSLKSYEIEKNEYGRANALNILGVAYGATSDIKKAVTIFNQSLKIAEKIEAKPILVNIYKNLSRHYADLNQLDKAEEFADKGLKIAMNFEDDYEVASLKNAKGKIYRLRANYEEAMQAFQESYELFEKVGSRIKMVVALNNIGVIYNRTGNSEKALEVLERSLALEQKIGAKHRIANIYNNIGRALLKEGRLEEAMEKFESCLTIYQEINLEYGIAATFQGMGLCFVEQKNYEQAINYFTKALEVSQHIKFERGITMLYLAIGSAYYQSEDQDRGIGWILKAIAYSNKLGVKNEKAINLLKQIKKDLTSEMFDTLIASSINELPQELFDEIEPDLLIQELS